MENGIVCVGIVKEQDGLIASAFVGSPEYLRQVYLDSYENPMIPMYYHEKLKTAKISLSHFQYVYDDKVVETFNYEYVADFIKFIDGEYKLPTSITNYVYIPADSEDFDEQTTNN